VGWNRDFIEGLQRARRRSCGPLEARRVAEGDRTGFGKPSSSIYFLVAPHGGIRPAERRRSRLALTPSEREEISRGITTHQSARSIAKLLGRSPLDGEPGNEPQWRLTLFQAMLLTLPCAVLLQPASYQLGRTVATPRS
jgi:hypothetical protein